MGKDKISYNGKLSLVQIFTQIENLVKNKISKFKFSKISWPCACDRGAQRVLSQFLFSQERCVFKLYENLHHLKFSRYTVPLAKVRFVFSPI